MTPHSLAQVDLVLATVLKAAQAIRDKGPEFAEELRRSATTAEAREYIDMAKVLAGFPGLDRYVELLHSEAAQALADLDSMLSTQD
jgi:hypothetical protein